jgi:archaetidylinositol phosphate synthase
MSDPHRQDVPHREVTSFTGAAERVVLDWLASRIPDRISPNHLTLLGIAGGAMTGIGYAMGATARGWLAVAILGFVVHWLGDSLDGTTARRRGVTRPRFGMFIDQASDLLSVLMITIGLGLSPWVRMDVALAAYAGYLSAAVMVHLRANVTGIYDIASGGMGPTEGRLILIVITLIMVIDGPSGFWMWDEFSGYDLGFMAIALWCAISFATQTYRIGRRLAAEEPPHHP